MAELTIGGLTGSVNYVPNRQARYYGYTQQIYLQSQINVGLITISQVYFYWEGSANEATRTITLYMNHTSKSTFIDGTDWTEKLTLNQVYTGNYVATTAAGWIGVTLDTNFVYNNTDNIVVSMHDSSGFSSDGDRHYGTASAGNTSIYYQNNVTNPDPTNPPTGVVALYKPDIKFVYTATPAIVKAGTDTTSSTLTSPSLSWSHTLVAGDNRLIIVTFSTENTDSDYSVSSVTYGGVSMTLARQAIITFSDTQIWYLLEADLPSNGSNTVTVTYTGTFVGFGCGGGCFEYTGVAQEAPEATDANTGTNLLTISNSISPSTDAWVISATCGGINGVTMSSGQGQVQQYDIDPGSGTCQCVMAELQGANGETSLSTSSSASQNRFARAAASFLPFTSGFPIYVNVSGTWKQVSAISANVAGTWKNVSLASANVAGTWKGVV